MSLLLSYTAGQFSGRTLKLSSHPYGKETYNQKRFPRQPYRRHCRVFENLGLSILLRNTLQYSQRNQTKYMQSSNAPSALAQFAKVVFSTLGTSRINETCTQMASWGLLGSCNKGRLPWGHSVVWKWPGKWSSQLLSVLCAPLREAHDFLLSCFKRVTQLGPQQQNVGFLQCLTLMTNMSRFVIPPRKIHGWHDFWGATER